MRLGIRQPLKPSSYPAYIYINFERPPTLHNDFLKFAAGSGMYKIPTGRRLAGGSVKYDSIACRCLFPSCSCRLHEHRHVLACRHNKHKGQWIRLKCTTWGWLLAACPSSLLLKKRILCSDLVFLLMFYDGVLRDHVHHGSDSGPAFLFRLLVLISTLQLHKWYSGQWLQISRLAPKVVLVMFKLVRSMILWDKMGVRNQVPSFKKQTKTIQ